MEQWEKNYYITSVAGACNGSALVVMSKGNKNLLNQSYICLFHFTDTFILSLASEIVQLGTLNLFS